MSGASHVEHDRLDTIGEIPALHSARSVRRHRADRRLLPVGKRRFFFKFSVDIDGRRSVALFSFLFLFSGYAAQGGGAVLDDVVGLRPRPESHPAVAEGSPHLEDPADRLGEAPSVQRTAQETHRQAAAHLTAATQTKTKKKERALNVHSEWWLRQ